MQWIAADNAHRDFPYRYPMLFARCRSCGSQIPIYRAAVPPANSCTVRKLSLPILFRSVTFLRQSNSDLSNSLPIRICRGGVSPPAGRETRPLRILLAKSKFEHMTIPSGTQEDSRFPLSLRTHLLSAMPTIFSAKNTGLPLRATRLKFLRSRGSRLRPHGPAGWT